MGGRDRSDRGGSGLGSVLARFAATTHVARIGPGSVAGGCPHDRLLRTQPVGLDLADAREVASQSQGSASQGFRQFEWGSGYTRVMGMPWTRGYL